MKRYLSLLLALSLCLALFACNKDPQGETPVDPPQNEQPEDPVVDPQPTPSDPVQPDPEPVTPDEPQDPHPAEPGLEVDHKETHYLIYDHTAGTLTNETVIDITLVMPEIEAMPQVTDYYEMLQQDLFNVYSLSVEDAILQRKEALSYGDEFRPWAMESDFEVLRNDGTVLSILREIYENRNAAHPSLVYFAETFAVESQGRLLLGDLFTVSEDEYLARLRDMIVAQMEARETNDGIVYFDYAREQLLSLFDPMDFALTEDSLLIFFNEYALAPYVAGPQHFYLPLSELSDILQPQWVN